MKSWVSYLVQFRFWNCWSTLMGHKHSHHFHGKYFLSFLYSFLILCALWCLWQSVIYISNCTLSLKNCNTFHLATAPLQQVRKRNIFGKQFLSCKMCNVTENSMPDSKPPFYSFVYGITGLRVAVWERVQRSRDEGPTKLTACCRLVMQDQLLKNKSVKFHIHFSSVTGVGHSNSCRWQEEGNCNKTEPCISGKLLLLPPFYLISALGPLQELSKQPLTSRPLGSRKDRVQWDFGE